MAIWFVWLDFALLDLFSFWSLWKSLSKNCWRKLLFDESVERSFHWCEAAWEKKLTNRSGGLLCCAARSLSDSTKSVRFVGLCNYRASRKRRAVQNGPNLHTCVSFFQHTTHFSFCDSFARLLHTFDSGFVAVLSPDRASFVRTVRKHFLSLVACLSQQAWSFKANMCLKKTTTRSLLPPRWI